MNSDDDIIYCWFCDSSLDTGEGKLGNIFIKTKFKQKIKIYSVKNLFSLKKIYFKIFNYKYISPFVGLLFCWCLYLQKKKVCYVNFLPLWNSILFIFLPPKTFLGPITGGANFKINFFREYLFPILYKLSEFFLNIRGQKNIFSTDLLKKKLSEKTRIRSQFNFINKYFLRQNKLNNNKNLKKKNIDFLIYFRKHKNKQSFFSLNFIKRLISYGYKIHIVGNYLNQSGVINHKFISNKKLENLLSRTRFTIASEENIYSLFILEAISNKVKILIPKAYKNRISDFKNDFIFLDYNKSYNLKNLILKISNNS